MSFDINGKVVLVTGANRGIGTAIVRDALQQGARRVYAAVRQLSSVDFLVKEFGTRVAPVQIDLEVPQTIDAAARIALDVDVVINNAGVLENAGPLSPDAFKALDREIKINVAGLLHIAQAFAPVLKANGGGALVQLNSVASLTAFSDFATYSASKAASYSITLSLRHVLAQQGTRVVSVHPGPIATDMAKQAGLEGIAEPATVVPAAIWLALKTDNFHAYPDALAKQIGEAYQDFAKHVIESPSSE